MPRSKEIQEQTRNKIVDMYQSGKVYKAISKDLGLTVRAIIHEWRKLGTVVNLPRSGRPTKITPKAQQRLIQEVIKEPRTTSKELQASLSSIKVSVNDSTIRKRLGKNGIHGRVPRQKPLLTNSADPRLLGALRKTVSGGLGGENGWDVSVRVSLRLESRSRKALEKQYLFRGSYKLSFFFFFLSKSKRLDDIHVTWFGWFVRRERDSAPH